MINEASVTLRLVVTPFMSVQTLTPQAQVALGSEFTQRPEVSGPSLVGSNAQWIHVE